MGVWRGGRERKGREEERRRGGRRFKGHSGREEEGKKDNLKNVKGQKLYIERERDRLK